MHKCPTDAYWRPRCSWSLMHCVSAPQAAKRSRRQGERHAAESDSDSAACKRGRRLWEEIHTVHYHRWAKTAGAQAELQATKLIALHRTSRMLPACKRTCQVSDLCRQDAPIDRKWAPYTGLTTHLRKACQLPARQLLQRRKAQTWTRPLPAWTSPCPSCSARTAPTCPPRPRSRQPRSCSC